MEAIFSYETWVIDALHVVISQKMGLLITTSVGTSNALKYLFNSLWVWNKDGTGSGFRPVVRFGTVAFAFGTSWMKLTHYRSARLDVRGVRLFRPRVLMLSASTAPQLALLRRPVVNLEMESLWIHTWLGARSTVHSSRVNTWLESCVAHSRLFQSPRALYYMNA
jgi:hypothetical protein